MGKAIIVPNITFTSNLGSVTVSDWPYNAIELEQIVGMQGGTQGSTVYGDLRFCGDAADNGAIKVFDMSTMVMLQTVTVPNAAATGRHMNSFCFGHMKYEDTDEFPLLYGGGNQGDLSNIIDVYRIVRDNGTFTITIVGSIDITMLGYADVAYWNDKLILRANNNAYIVSLPSDNLTGYVLAQEDIIAQYSIGTSRAYMQQPCVFNNHLYMPFLDTHTSKGTYDYMMKVMDLATGRVVMNAEFNYNNNYSIEFRSVFAWNNHLYLDHSGNGYLVKLTVNPFA